MSRAGFGLLMTVFFGLMATVGPLLVPLDPRADYEQRFRPPSPAHLLGTDYAGRDVLAQIVHGSTDVLLIAVSTAFFGVALAVAFGFTAGLLGGRVDMAITHFSDVILTLPRFALMAIFAGLLRISDPLSFGLVLALFDWPGLARALRNQVLTLRQKEFIEVCRVMHMPRRHVMFRELLPNMMPFLAINFIGIAQGAITASVGIMLLGLVPLSFTNWGMMLNLAATQTGAIYLPNAYAYLFAPIFFIVLLQFSLICLASGLEERWDPRLQ